MLEPFSVGLYACERGGVTVGKYAFVGAGGVVTKDVPDYGLVYAICLLCLAVVSVDGYFNRVSCYQAC